MTSIRWTPRMYSLEFLTFLFWAEETHGRETLRFWEKYISSHLRNILHIRTSKQVHHWPKTNAFYSLSFFQSTVSNGRLERMTRISAQIPAISGDREMSSSLSSVKFSYRVVLSDMKILLTLKIQRLYNVSLSRPATESAVTISKRMHPPWSGGINEETVGGAIARRWIALVRIIEHPKIYRSWEKMGPQRASVCARV